MSDSNYCSSCEQYNQHEPWCPFEKSVGFHPQEEPSASFQTKVRDWCVCCFGETISDDKIERNHRFLEESLELVQSLGCTKEEAIKLVDYVFSRPVGEVNQELGGVMVTIAALAAANKLDMDNAGLLELARVWTKMETIRAKQAAKPKYSPLPQ